MCCHLSYATIPAADQAQHKAKPIRGYNTQSSQAKPHKQMSRSGATVKTRVEEGQCHVTGASECKVHKRTRMTSTLNKQDRSKGEMTLQGQRIHAIQWPRPHGHLEANPSTPGCCGASWSILVPARNEYPGFNGKRRPNERPHVSQELPRRPSKPGHSPLKRLCNG